LASFVAAEDKGQSLSPRNNTTKSLKCLNELIPPQKIFTVYQYYIKTRLRFRPMFKNKEHNLKYQKDDFFFVLSTPEAMYFDSSCQSQF